MKKLGPTLPTSRVFYLPNFCKEHQMVSGRTILLWSRLRTVLHLHALLAVNG